MKIFMSSNNRLKLKHYRVEFGVGENSMSVPEYQADDYTMDMQAISKGDAAAEVHFGLEYAVSCLHNRSGYIGTYG